MATNPLTPRINNIDTRIDNKDVKNVIINGGFDFWQRGNSATAIGPFATYLSDRFLQQIGSGSPMAANQYREEDVPAELANDVKYCLVAETTTDGIPATTDFHVIQQKIEGHFFKKLVGKNAVLSFYVKSSVVGTYTILLRNVGLDRHYATQYTIDSVDTWEKKKIVLPITETGGTWDYENGSGLEVIWSLGSGPDRNIPVLDTWTDAVGTFLGHSSQVNFNNTIGNTFKITGVMLTEDTGEPDFDPDFQRAGRNYQEELQLCQRYFEKSFDIDIAPIPSNLSGPQGFYAATTGLEWDGNNFHSQAFATKKRTSPIMTTMNTSSSGTNIFYVRNGGGSGNGNHGGIAASETSYRMQGNFLGSGSFLDIVYVYYGWTADAEL